MKIANHINKNFDYKIFVNLPKSHNYAIATFGIKNMMGVIRQEDKSLIHGLRIPNAPEFKTIFTYLPTWVIAWMRRRVPRLVDLVFKHSESYQKAIWVIHHNIASVTKAVFYCPQAFCQYSNKIILLAFCMH